LIRARGQGGKLADALSLELRSDGVHSDGRGTQGIRQASWPIEQNRHLQHDWHERRLIQRHTNDGTQGGNSQEKGVAADSGSRRCLRGKRRLTGSRFAQGAKKGSENRPARFVVRHFGGNCDHFPRFVNGSCLIPERRNRVGTVSSRTGKDCDTRSGIRREPDCSAPKRSRHSGLQATR
jgi:hypothetical protein